ncbi:MAG: glutamate--tRNA ligase family protein, partial [Candidatus Omnitrophota bacterium]
NTPKQIALYNALGSLPPAFAHIPLILGQDRSRLSKRHGATSIAEYKEAGYMPEAMVNFMALLGWSPGGNREIMTRNEIVEAFSANRIVKTAAIFNEDKLSWINAQHIKLMDSDAIIGILKPELKRCRYAAKKIDRNRMKNIIRLFKPRMKNISDFCQQADYLFASNVKYETEAVNKFLKRKELKVIFSLLIQDLEHVKPFTSETIERCCRDIIAKLGIGGGDLIHPTRAAVTGRTSSPGLFEVMQLLGKKETIKRLKFSLKKYCK